MAERSRSEDQNGFRSILDELPVDRLKSELQDALAAAAERTAEAASDKISGLAERLTDVAANGGVTGKALAEGGKAAATGGSPLLGALKGGVMGAKDKAAEALGGGSGSGGKKNPLKATTIIESIDVGVPIEVAYNQWTQFQDFSGFMKKVEQVEQESDEKLEFKAKILWSHRSWQATILEQVPEDKIVWRSKGDKGHVDGSVTFHELAPNLTRIIVVLEYYPQGLFERVGNIWRAQGRRARVELKHFQRHVMTRVVLHPDEVEGWRGEIHGGSAEPGDESEEESAEEEPEDEYEDEEEPEDEYEEDEYADEDEYAEDEDEGEEEGEYEDEGDEEEAEPEDEYAEEEPAEEEEPEDEYEEDEYEDEGEEAGEYEDEGDEEEAEPEDEYAEEEPAEEEEPEDEYEEDEYEDEYDEGEDGEEYEDEDEYDEEPEERPRRRAS
ncbi:SRPBCC family protein [Kribbella shirazensis]|uniref:Putative membrane protein n=1 Tax=Kribbella shirazensis TaxID=1105143 RepID=A0A7X5VK54_9ACTN|nr:SRPBCC family protein [Kribbella shirazensis]NIK61613.1 putative membrane protein [Kribbella shirazensis]